MVDAAGKIEVSIQLLNFHLVLQPGHIIILTFSICRRSVRSGYAFAHQEGFGRLITSGRIMKQNQTGNPVLPSFHASMIQAMPKIRTSSKSKQKSTTPVQEESIVQDYSASDKTNKTSNSNIQTVQLSINGQSRDVSLPNQVSN